jgi:dihydrofolate reductase
MSKVVVTSIVSVDGYTEGPHGDVMAMPMDHAFDEYNAERMRSAGSLLFGGTTYRGFVGFWPTALENPELTPGSTEIAQRYADGIPITVVSDTLTEDETGPWRDQTTIVRRADAHEAVARLREQDGGDALMYGSRTLWGDLLAHGLVDELHLMVGPKLVAGDHHAFAGVPPTGLQLLDVRQWDGSDNVLLSYAVG